MADKPDNTKLLTKMRERFVIASDAESQIRKDALEDLQFRVGDQWPDEIKRQRYQDQRPCLTINQIPPFGKYRNGISAILHCCKPLAD